MDPVKRSGYFDYEVAAKKAYFKSSANTKGDPKSPIQKPSAKKKETPVCAGLGSPQMEVIKKVGTSMISLV
ncbi:hypothetical protein NZK33_18635 [Cyanobium sp. FGCU-6]|nr:hypothetical protein [Cyanobium sp. FGCU6]